jgi:hypothetical protein
LHWKLSAWYVVIMLGTSIQVFWATIISDDVIMQHDFTKIIKWWLWWLTFLTQRTADSFNASICLRRLFASVFCRYCL